jgi:inorganic triphosphatase YgiF
MAHEVELKFELAPELIAAVESSRWLSELSDSDSVEQAVSVYFDTRKHKLRRRGMSLRIRHAGDRRIQTLKVAKAGTLDRTEWEAELDGDTPDLSLIRGGAARRLRVTRLKNKLLPVFETRVERRTIPVQWNGSQIEIAIDRGCIEANGCTVGIHEVEFELKAGDGQNIVPVAERLLEQIPARFGLLSKAERGYALAAHESLAPVRAEPIELEKKATVAGAFRVIALSCLRHFALNERGVLGHHVESVHQMRVGLRRLRAALSIFKDLVEDPQSQHIKEELRWLSEQLGQARDYDVFAHENPALDREAELHAGPVHELKSLLDERFAAGLAQAAATVGSDRFRTIVLTTALWIVGGHWVTSEDELLRLRRAIPLRTFAKRVLDARVRKLRKKLGRLDELDELQRHKLRIGVKKLHYATEFVSSLYPNRSAERKRFTRVLKCLQDTLGQLNDCVVHERVASDLVQRNGERLLAASPVYAAGLVRGQEDARLELLMSTASKAGARLARLQPFWR